MEITDYYLTLSDDEKLIYRHGYIEGRREEYGRISELPPVNPQEPKTGQYEKHTDHTDCIWYGSDSGCPVTCSQYRDGWNDAMDYIFKNGKGYQPYRRTGSVEMRISQATDFLAEARACAESEDRE